MNSVHFITILLLRYHNYRIFSSMHHIYILVPQHISILFFPYFCSTLFIIFVCLIKIYFLLFLIQELIILLLYLYYNLRKMFVAFILILTDTILEIIDKYYNFMITLLILQHIYVSPIIKCR